MLIIAEGMDNSGKTSLCKYIQENSKYGVKLFHSSPDIDQHQRLFEILESVNRPHRITVCDRIGIIGEEVYGKRLRGSSKFNADMETMLRTFILAASPHPVIFFHCNPTTFSLGPKFEMEGVRENQEALYRGYEDVMGRVNDVFRELYCYGYAVEFHEHDYQLDPDFAKLPESIRRILK